MNLYRPTAWGYWLAEAVGSITVAVFTHNGLLFWVTGVLSLAVLSVTWAIRGGPLMARVERRPRTEPPDPIADMVATKRRIRADELQRWDSEFQALLPPAPKATPKFTAIPNYPYFVELPAGVATPNEIREFQSSWDRLVTQRAAFQPSCTGLTPTNPPSPRVMVTGPNPGAGTVINIQPPDPARPRIDAVYETWRGIQVVTGIPAVSPMMPRSRPEADAKFLGSVVVRPYTMSITAADIHAGE